MYINRATEDTTQSARRAALGSAASGCTVRVVSATGGSVAVRGTLNAAITSKFEMITQREVVRRIMEERRGWTLKSGRPPPPDATRRGEDKEARPSLPPDHMKPAHGHRNSSHIHDSCLLISGSRDVHHVPKLPYMVNSLRRQLTQVRLPPPCTACCRKWTQHSVMLNS